MSTQTENKSKVDVYEVITSRIISHLEKGVVPWRQPWTKASVPRNLISLRNYRGINLWLLITLGYERNYFLTLKQINDLGGSVKKGEKACPIVFWTTLEPKEGEPVNGRQKSLLRYYNVFNIEQCKGIPEEKIPVNAMMVKNDPIKICEDIVANMPKKPKVYHKEHRAYYNPVLDYVNMPRLKSFESSEAYYDTLFHELVHSTAHESRLNRKDSEEVKSGKEAYSFEELVAEIGACYLNSHAGIVNAVLENSVSYINAWLERLKNDKRMIIFASAKAQKATDFILDIMQPVEIEEMEH